MLDDESVYNAEVVLRGTEELIQDTETAIQILVQLTDLWKSFHPMVEELSITLLEDEKKYLDLLKAFYEMFDNIVENHESVSDYYVMAANQLRENIVIATDSLKEKRECFLIFIKGLM